MKIRILATGSKANCYAIVSGSETILLDSGLGIKATIAKLGYKLPDAILITHEHGDHANSAKAFLERGVDVYMTAGTAAALELSRHNLHIIRVGEKFTVGKFKVTVIGSKHDAAEPANFIIEDDIDRLLYVTDTGEVPKVDGRFTKMLLEANHFTENIRNSPNIDAAQKRRIMQNHLSFEKAVDFLQTHQADEVYLIHISSRHGDGESMVELATMMTDVKKIYAAK